MRWASQFPITHQVQAGRTLEVPLAVLITTPVLVVRVPKTAPVAKSEQWLPSRQNLLHHLKHIHVDIWDWSARR